MNPAEVHWVSEAVLRRAQRQGSVMEGEIREEIAKAGLPQADWHAVLSLLGPALVPEQGWYRYAPPAVEATRHDLALAHCELLAKYAWAVGPQGIPKPASRLGPYPVRVRTTVGRELPVLLLLDPSLSWVRLVVARTLVGSKVRILVPRPGSGAVMAWDVRVLWAMRLADDLFENGAAFLCESGQSEGWSGTHHRSGRYRRGTRERRKGGTYPSPKEGGGSTRCRVSCW